MSEEMKRIHMLIGLLQLYVDEQQHEYGYPIGQLHELLYDVYRGIHNEIGRSVIPGYEDI